ncbi:helix-turn-helix domain-containing protein, partial [Patescibacteria group bacterium]
MPKRLPVNQKIKLIKRVKAGESVSKVCRQAGIARKTFYQWKKLYQQAPRRTKRESLAAKYVSGKSHPHSKRHQIEEMVFSVSICHPEWGSRKISAILNKHGHLASSRTVYRLLKDRNLATEARRREFADLYQVLGIIKDIYNPKQFRLAPETRKKVLEEVILGGKSVAETCRKYRFSRKTYYKWFARYQEAEKNGEALLQAVDDQYARDSSHPKTVPENTQKKIFAIVRKQPELSPHRIAKLIPSISNHGIYNVLKRNNLNTYELRLAYSRTASRRTTFAPVFGFAGKLRKLIGSIPSISAIPPPTSPPTSLKLRGMTWLRGAGPLFRQPKQALSPLLRPFTASLLVSLLFSNFSAYWINMIAKTPATGDRIGLVFTSMSLMIGGIFFIYSMKYYLTLAIVLSFSRQSTEDSSMKNLGDGYSVGLQSLMSTDGKHPGAKTPGVESETPGVTSWVAKIFGINTPMNADRKLMNTDYQRGSAHYQRRSVDAKSKGGLLPSLDHITLKRKPFVSIHLPFYNEEKVAKRIMTACTSMDYYQDGEARFEVIVCDDSTDETVDIVNNFARKYNLEHGWGEKAHLEVDGKGHRAEGIGHRGHRGHKGKDPTLYALGSKPKTGPRIKVLHRPTREGFKGAALGYALKRVDSRTEFISVFDADFVPYPDTLELFVKYFQVNGALPETLPGSGAIRQLADQASLSRGGLKADSRGQKAVIESGREKTEEKYPSSVLSPQFQSSDPRHPSSRSGSNIAAVTGYQWHVLNKSENWITRGVRTEYAGSYVIERPGREILGLLKQIHGTVYMIKRNVLEQVGWGTSI